MTKTLRLPAEYLNLAVASSGLLSTRILAFITSILIAQNSSVETFGEFSFFVVIFVLVSEVGNAIDTSYIRFANGNYAKASQPVYFTGNIIFKLFYLIAAALIAILFSDALAQIIFKKPDSASAIKAAILSGALLTVFNSTIAYYLRQNRQGIVAILRPISYIFIFLALIALWRSRGAFTITDIETAYIYCCGFLAASTLLMTMSSPLKNCSGLKEIFAPYAKVIGTLLSTSFINLLATRLDIFILASLLSFEEVGLYGAAVRITVFVSLFTAAMTSILVPKAHIAYRDSAGKDQYRSLIYKYAFFQTFVALLIAISANPIIDILFGEEYQSIGTVTIILLLQAIFESYGRGYQALIQCGPQPGILFRFAILKLIASAILLNILVPIWGITGAAISITISSGFLSILMFQNTREVLKHS